ncbi:S-adenosyl-L-methionine-dependent methyltransferase [Pilobolus umbonatus]|nr:S-adenosyl-L-methionine-dependent methyltransferase [Pilobolus umbonatus]
MYSSTLSDEYPTTLNSAHPIPFKNIANDPSTSVVERKKVLENLDFYKANVLEVALPFEDNHFDFVIQRLVATSFTVANWKRVLTELLRVTKPGGYIQLVEIDYYTFELPEEGKKWEAQLLSILQDQRQMVPRMATQLPQALKALGLTEVDSTYVSIPLGSWGLDLGVLWKNNMEMFLDATGPLLSKIAGIPQKEYKQRWREMLDTQGLKPFNNIHCAWGKKPIDGVIDWNLCPLLSAK